MEIKLNVYGMMCERCEARVETAVKDLAGVKSVKADHTENLVSVSGENLNEKAVISAIEDLGYEVK